MKDTLADTRAATEFGIVQMLPTERRLIMGLGPILLNHKSR